MFIDQFSLSIPLLTLNSVSYELLTHYVRFYLLNVLGQHHHTDGHQNSYRSHVLRGNALLTLCVGLGSRTKSVQEQRTHVERGYDFEVGSNEALP